MYQQMRQDAAYLMLNSNALHNLEEDLPHPYTRMCLLHPHEARQSIPKLPAAVRHLLHPVNRNREVVVDV